MIKGKAICVDNSGASATYGAINSIINIGDEVDIIDQSGCCYIIKKDNGNTYILNVTRFKLI